MYELYITTGQRITGPMPIDKAIEQSIELRRQGLKVEIRQYTDVDLPELDIYERAKAIFEAAVK